MTLLGYIIFALWLGQLCPQLVAWALVFIVARGLWLFGRYTFGV